MFEQYDCSFLVCRKNKEKQMLEFIKKFEEFLGLDHPKELIHKAVEAAKNTVDANDHAILKTARQIAFKLLNIPEELHAGLLNVDIAKQADAVLDRVIDGILDKAEEKTETQPQVETPAVS
jgi:hypothetical protein